MTSISSSPSTIFSICRSMQQTLYSFCSYCRNPAGTEEPGRLTGPFTQTKISLYYEHEPYHQNCNWKAITFSGAFRKPNHRCRFLEIVNLTVLKRLSQVFSNGFSNSYIYKAPELAFFLEDLKQETSHLWPSCISRFFSLCSLHWNPRKVKTSKMNCQFCVIFIIKPNFLRNYCLEFTAKDLNLKFSNCVGRFE